MPGAAVQELPMVLAWRLGRGRAREACHILCCYRNLEDP